MSTFQNVLHCIQFEIFVIHIISMKPLRPAGGAHPAVSVGPNAPV